MSRVGLQTKKLDELIEIMQGNSSEKAESQTSDQTGLSITPQYGEHTFREIFDLLKSSVTTAERSFMKVSALFWVVNQSYMADIYRLGYDSVFDFAEAEFGFLKTSVKNMISIVNRFCACYGRDVLIHSEYKDYSYSQLVELCSVDDYYLSEFNPKMTVKAIREKKKALKAPMISSSVVEESQTSDQEAAKSNEPKYKDGDWIIYYLDNNVLAIGRILGKYDKEFKCYSVKPTVRVEKCYFSSVVKLKQIIGKISVKFIEAILNDLKNPPIVEIYKEI